MARARLSGERGVVLTIVLVFLVLLSLGSFFGAALTRTNIRVVTNEQNERKAFYVAEAGVTETLLRMGMNDPTNRTVDGNTFNAAFTPDFGNVNWKAKILFSGTGPVTTGSGSTFLLTTPTIQPAAARLAYSTTGATDADAMTIQWEINGTAIRRIGGRQVLDIRSVGQSGAGRRQVTVAVTSDGNGPAVHTNSSGVCPGIEVDSSARLVVFSGIQDNSTCSSALKVGSSATLQASGDVMVVGGNDSNGATSVAPTPSTSQPSKPDPLASLLPPCFGSVTTGCNNLPTAPQTRNGSATNPSTLQIGSSRTLNPGIYYGGIRMNSGTVVLNPGVYIMAGGGLEVRGGNLSSASGGVMFYNTRAPGTTSGDWDYERIRLDSNGPINLAAPSSDYYAGIGFYQDRANTQNVEIEKSPTLDGVIYAINSYLRLEADGGTNPAVTMKTQMVVGRAEFGDNITLNRPTNSPLRGGFTRIAWQDY